jgi:hypothetical protein
LMNPTLTSRHSGAKRGEEMRNEGVRTEALR